MVADLGLGTNDGEKGFEKLRDGIATDEVGCRMITHRDLLVRFGAELASAAWAVG